MTVTVELHDREQVALGGTLLLRRGSNEVPAEVWTEMKRGRRTRALLAAGVLAEAEEITNKPGAPRTKRGSTKR
jgi:hypothetical protein